MRRGSKRVEGESKASRRRVERWKARRPVEGESTGHCQNMSTSRRAPFVLILRRVIQVDRVCVPFCCSGMDFGLSQYLFRKWDTVCPCVLQHDE